jgi:hypothetical protein
MMKRFVVSLAVLTACGRDNDDCSSTTCAAACASAGFTSGTCVDGACQCTTQTQTPAGTITGSALLFGHGPTGNAGIAVSVAGTSTVAMTAADGTYSVDVPAGAYALSFAMPKYIDASIASVVVEAASTSIAPTVTLTHGHLVGALAPSATTPDAAFYSPDRTHVVIDTISPTPTVTMLDGIVADGSSDVALFEYPTTGSFVAPAFVVTNDGVAYQQPEGVWSRPLDASTSPHLIIPTPGAFGSSVRLVGGSEHFAVAFLTDTSKTFALSLVAARTDGAASVVLWTQGSATQFSGQLLRAGDDAIAFVVSDTAGAATAIHSFDPVHGVDTVASLSGLAGGSFTGVNFPFAQTPDRQWFLFSGPQNGVARTVLYQLGTTSVAVSPNASTVRPNTAEAMYDSSGFTFADDTANGYWFWGTTVVGSTNPLVLVPPASFNPNAGFPSHLYGSVVPFVDVADSNRLKVVSVPTAGALVPSTFPLDITPGRTFWQVNAAHTELDAVWSSTGVQLKGVTIPLPMTAAPNVATLGSPLGTVCAQYFTNALRSTPLLNGAFFYLCPDTNTLFRYSPPFTGNPSPTTVDSPVTTMQPLPQGIAYFRGDGTWYVADASSTTLVSRTAPSWITFFALAQWLLFDDDAQIARASRIDGSAIDEPLVACTLASNGLGFGPAPAGEMQPEIVGADVLAPTSTCGAIPNPYSVAVANLP